MSTHRFFIVFNPVAGANHREQVYQTFGAMFGKAGIVYEVYETSAKELLDHVIRRAIEEHFTTIVVAGGDGTVSAVVHSLIGSTVPLGIVPLGTTNMVARELGIPLHLEEACQVLLQSQRTRQLDVMQVGKRAFLSHISLGIYARIAAQATRRAKRRFGRLVNVWYACHELWKQEIWPFTVTVDGHTHHVRTSLILVANVGAFGFANLRWGAHIVPYDGEIDVCILRAKTFAASLHALWHVLYYPSQRSSAMTYLRAKHHVVITTTHPLPVRADGEIIGQSTVQIRVRPQAVKVVIPEAHADVPHCHAADLHPE